VFAVAWLPDGQRLASEGADETVHVWVASQEQILPFLAKKEVETG
jgi:hypothetical protein